MAGSARAATDRASRSNWPARSVSVVGRSLARRMSGARARSRALAVVGRLLGEVGRCHLESALGMECVDEGVRRQPVIIGPSFLSGRVLLTAADA